MIYVMGAPQHHQTLFSINRTYSFTVFKMKAVLIILFVGSWLQVFSQDRSKGKLSSFTSEIPVDSAKGPIRKLKVSFYSICKTAQNIDSGYLIRILDKHINERGKKIHTNDSDLVGGYAKIIISDSLSQEKIERNKDSGTYAITTKTWDQKHEITTTITGRYGSNDRDTTISEFINERRGRTLIRHLTGKYQSNPSYKTITRYNRRGNIIKSKNYTNGEIYFKETNHYYKNGIRKETVVKNIFHKKTLSVLSVTFKSNGDLARISYTDVEKTAKSFHALYKFDSAHHKLECITYTANNMLETISYYTYDSLGNKTKKITKDDKGNTVYVTEYKYNDSILSEKNAHIKIQNVNQLKSTFDNYGNWLQVTEYWNGVPQYLAIREIEYY